MNGNRKSNSSKSRFKVCQAGFGDTETNAESSGVECRKGITEKAQRLSTYIAAW
jgi:hypothetical protein